MGREVIEEASCSSAPEPPKREEFERSLKEICDKIKNVSDEIMKNRQISNLKIERTFLQSEMDSIKKKLDARKPKLEKLKNERREKENMLTEMENSIIFKDEKKLRICLEKAQKEYESRSCISLREDQVLTKRLNILSQNLDLLCKYNIVNEEKRILLEMERKEREQQKILLKSKRSTADKLLDIRNRMEFCKRTIDRLSSQLKELLLTKNELIKNYESKVEAYSLWTEKKKKAIGNLQSVTGSKDGAYPETFPLSSHHKRRRDKEEEEVLEPFYEYKAACRRLISYLESLIAQTEDEENSTSNENESMVNKNDVFLNNEDDGNDSSEEFPPGFVTLRSNTSLPTELQNINMPFKSISVLSAFKKKFNKRSCKKPSQRINHMLCFIRLFNEIRVPIPADYQHVRKALEEVKLRLEACKEKTNIIVWEDSDYQKMTIPSLSSADSYWNGSADVSEVSSIDGNPLTQCSISKIGSCGRSLAKTEINTVRNSFTNLSLYDSDV
uniref:Lebercilin domain-containing protein n=1 Tax=Syphacia muris TaxID=451379 RepID=A0A0N5ARM5_9BILA